MPPGRRFRRFDPRSEVSRAKGPDLQSSA